MTPTKPPTAPPTRRRTLSGRLVPRELPDNPWHNPAYKRSVDPDDIQHRINPRKRARTVIADGLRDGRKERRARLRADILERLRTPAPSRRALLEQARAETIERHPAGKQIAA